MADIQSDSTSYPIQVINALNRKIVEDNELIDKEFDISLKEIRTSKPISVYKIYVSPHDTSSLFTQIRNISSEDVEYLMSLLPDTTSAIFDSTSSENPYDSTSLDTTSTLLYPDSTSLIVKHYRQTVWARYSHRDNPSSSFTIEFETTYSKF